MHHIRVIGPRYELYDWIVILGGFWSFRLYGCATLSPNMRSGLRCSDSEVDLRIFASRDERRRREKYQESASPTGTGRGDALFYRRQSLMVFV